MSQAPYPPGGYAYGPGQGQGYQPGQPHVGFAPQPGYGPPPRQNQGYGSLAFDGRADQPTYTGSDVPAQDVFDNQFSKVPTPSAPPPDMFAQYTGYENTHFGSSFVPPPPPFVPPPSSEMPEQHFQQSTAINDDQARDAMLQFVSEHCCYGKAPAQEMAIKDVTPSSAYHYALTSFCESRKTEWKYEPYQGQPIDSPVNGPAPLPWDIVVQPGQMFSDSKTKLEVPHTANIKPCHDCRAVGYVRCYKCCGRGRLRCSMCQGSGLVEGMEERQQCSSCFGRGWKMCEVCNGHGRIKCPVCQGNAQLKTFIELTVKWENQVSNHVVGRTDQLPNHLIVDSQGTEIFSEERPRVWPITSFFDQQVNIGSKRLVEEHSNKWPTKRILLQETVSIYRPQNARDPNVLPYAIPCLHRPVPNGDDDDDVLSPHVTSPCCTVVTSGVACPTWCEKRLCTGPPWPNIATRCEPSVKKSTVCPSVRGMVSPFSRNGS